MQVLDTFDVIIVGAGPSGSTLGYYLSENGFKVLIIDKKESPRYKPCGGGITKRARIHLPIDFSEIVEDYSSSAKIYFNNIEIFSKTFDSPIVSMVMRDKFDHFLINKAKKKGAVFKDKTKFLSVNGNTNNLQVQTSGGCYKTRLIIGADGVLSEVAKELKLVINYKTMVGLEAEVYLSNRDLLENYKNTVYYDFGIIRRGYGWIFPKRDHLSMGVLSIATKEKSIKHKFYGYLNTKIGAENCKIKIFRAHLIPYSPDKRNVYANDKGLTLGDASGHVDPITGEGIYYAVKEAEIAAKIITNYLNNKIDNLETYNYEIKKEVVEDLDRAKFLAGLLYRFPSIGYNILKYYGQKLGEKHVKVITGEKSYSELKRQLINPFILIDLLFQKCKLK